MSEWSSYSLSDFLLFSPRTYHRLFELYNEAIFPAQIAAVALGVALVVLLQRPGTLPGRLAGAILAVVWLWVAIAFHAMRYATINWAAVYLAAAFLIEGGLLGATILTGLWASRRGGTGFGLIALAIAYPLVAPLFGRPWSQAEFFGLAPDPTVIATLGALLIVRGWFRWTLAIVPLAWCAVGGATLWTMEAPDAWILPLAGAVFIGAALFGTVSRGDNRRATASCRDEC
jgi:hypothetical protein